MLRISVIASIGMLAAVSYAQNERPQDSKTPAHPRTRNVAVVVYEGAELLDFAGPYETFTAAARGPGAPESGWFNVYTVAQKAGAIDSLGVKIEPRFTTDNCPKPDILVIPGGEVGALLDDPRFMSWVGDNASQREITMSVCNGALVLANCRLLDGKNATTHWSAINGLKRDAPTANVRDDVRFVDNGSIITTAGVSAGIDGALHVVARLLGKTSADQTARYMQYEWRPEAADAARYSAVNSQLDERGRALQQADTLRQKKNWPEAIKAYEALTQQYPDDPDAWYLLGFCVHSSGDIDRAIDVHKKAASFNVRKQRPLYNLACAYALKGDKDKALETLNEAAEAGFNSADYVEGDDDWKSLRDDPRFKAAIQTMRRASSPSS